MRRPVAAGRPVVVKVGSSSIAAPGGGIDPGALGRVVAQIAALHTRGHPAVLVSSGAVAAGLPSLGLATRPDDLPSHQAAAAVGQSRLMEQYAALFAGHGITVGQVLLTRDVLARRSQYLHARDAMARLLGLGVVPIVNENDTVVVDELRFGDNDRLAAIVAHLVDAGMLVVLTDTGGLYTDDPRRVPDSTLLSAVRHTDEILDVVRRSSGSGVLGSGGVATKVAAARMAAYSGIPTVIAAAADETAVAKAVTGVEVGTWIDPRRERLPARKLWIAFGQPSEGHLAVDAGAERALVDRGGSLLAVGVTEVIGAFEAGAAVEIAGPSGTLVGKGLVGMSAEEVRAVAGRHSSLAGGAVVHRDDLVLFA